MTLDKLFGELRSLLSGKVFDPNDRDKLLDLVHDAIRLDPEGYAEKWLPYLEGSRIEWPVPFATLQNPETVARWAEILPFATFALDLQHNDYTWEGRSAEDGERPFGIPFEHIRELRLDSLRTKPNTLSTLFNAPGMKHVTELCFDAHHPDPRWKDEISQGTLDILCRATYLHQIERLTLEHNLIHGTQLPPLLRSRVMRGVKVLILDQNNIGNQGLLDLVTSPNAEHLRVLGLRDNNITDLAPLATQAVCTELESLSLDRNPIGDNGAVKLAASQLKKLDTLSLAQCDIGDRGLEALWRSNTLRPPHTLDLATNHITHDAMAAFAQSAWTSRLIHLDVSNNNLDARGFGALHGAPMLRQLETLKAANWGQISTPLDITVKLLEQLDPNKITTLDLSGTTIGEDGARIIAQMSALQSLKLNGAHVTEGGVRALANAPSLANLEVLELDNNNITDPSAVALATSPHLSNLRKLSLFNNRIGDSGMIAFTREDSLPRLEFLNMISNYVGEDASKALLESEAIRRLRVLYLVANPLSNGRAQELERVLSPYMNISCIQRLG